MADGRGDLSATPPTAWPSARSDFAGALKWLLAGTLAYALLLLVAIRAEPEPSAALAPGVAPSIWLTPVFGMPYAIASLRWRARGRRLFYFALVVPLAHMAGHYLAYASTAQTFRPVADGAEFARHFVSGAWGGVTGAVLAFTGLALLGLAPRTRATLRKAALGTVALGATGGATMAWGLSVTQALRTLDTGDIILWLECVHAPWQALFALFLAWMLRIPPKRRWRLVRIERRPAG